MAARSLFSPRFWWFSLLGLSVLLRIGVILARPDQLTTDRDLYLGISTELREGHGFATPGSVPSAATAFRPPLYPLLLVLTGGSRNGIAAIHLLLAVVMVLATGMAAERLATDERGPGCLTPRLLAGGIVAVDPLLLLYSGQPMTETLCSCLTAVLVWWLAGSSSRNHRGAIIAGFLWGFCLLSRPTYAAPLGIYWLGRILSKGEPRQSLTSLTRPRADNAGHSGWRVGLTTLVVTLAVVSPWAIRNWFVFGTPIMTTTHGGYTLWLANNPVYYAEVIEGGDAAWNGESLDRWQRETNTEMDRLAVHGEVARDRWQSTRAKQFIRESPWRFVRACLHRAVKFWSIFPGRSADTGVPLPMLWIIAGGYAALWVGGVVSVGRLWKDGGMSRMWPASSLIFGFAVVHLVYWTDARMRAPIIPAVAVLVAAGLHSNQKVTRECVVPSDPKSPMKTS